MQCPYQYDTSHYLQIQKKTSEEVEGHLMIFLTSNASFLKVFAAVGFINDGTLQCVVDGAIIANRYTYTLQIILIHEALT